MTEEWKSIPSYPEYEASNTGKVRLGKTELKQRINKPEFYPQVSLKKGKNWKVEKVHALVLEAFVGPRPMTPSKHDGCHNDGNRQNNNLLNLRWATRKENVADSIKHGTYVRGTKQGACKLTDDQVIEMRRKYENGISCAKLAKLYGISKPNAHRIVTRVSWKHI